MIAVNQPAVSQLWQEFYKTRSEEARNNLVEHYLNIVKCCANAVHSKVPGKNGFDDLTSAGAIGLMEAISSFDINRGVKFETYSTPRIRGAILDYLRDMDWVPRLVRDRAHKLQKARIELEQELGRKPYEEELARKIGSKEKLQKLERGARTIFTSHLHERIFESVRNPREECPEERLAKKEKMQLILQGLSPSEKLTIELYYLADFSQGDIGKVVGLDEAEISRIRTRAIRKLQRKLLGREKLGLEKAF